MNLQEATTLVSATVAVGSLVLAMLGFFFRKREDELTRRDREIQMLRADNALLETANGRFVEQLEACRGEKVELMKQLTTPTTLRRRTFRRSRD